MLFLIGWAFVVALAASVLAQTADFNPIYTPAKDEVVVAGQTFNITWRTPTRANELVTIRLIGGPEQNLQQPIRIIASKTSCTTYA